MTPVQLCLPGLDCDTQQEGVVPLHVARSPFKGNMTVRHFTSRDIPGMIECGRLMHAESRYRHLSFNESKIMRRMEQIAALPDCNWCGYVAVDDNDVVHGVIGGYITTYPFSDDTVAYDFVLFVRPTSRGGIVAKQLAYAYVKWAQSKHAGEIIVGVSSGVADARVGTLYERIGFERLAATYRYAGEQL